MKLFNLILLSLFLGTHAMAADGSADANPILGIEKGSNNEPTYIKSNTLKLEAKPRVFTYEGSVEVKNGDLLIYCESLVGTYSEKNEIEQLTATRNVVIHKGEKLHGTGQRAVYSRANETVVLTENPELQQEGSVLSADKITMFLKDDRSAAEGNVRVKVVKKADAPAAPVS